MIPTPHLFTILGVLADVRDGRPSTDDRPDAAEQLAEAAHAVMVELDERVGDEL